MLASYFYLSPWDDEVGQIAILTRIRGVKFVSYVKPSGIDVCIAIVQASEEVHGEIAKVAGVRRLTIDEANELLRRYGLLIDARWLLRQVESRNAQRRPRPTANAVIYTNDFSNVAATFTTEFLSNITQEQLATEFREYWLNVAGLAKGGSANLGVDSLGSIRDYSNLTMDAFLGQLADPVQGQPGWHIAYAAVTATYDTTYGLATSSAIYVCRIYANANRNAGTIRHRWKDEYKAGGRCDRSNRRNAKIAIDNQIRTRVVVRPNNS